MVFINKKVKTVAVIIVAAAVIFLGAYAANRAYPGLVFIIKSCFSSTGSVVTLKEAAKDYDTQSITVSELKTDERCVFDQSLMLINSSYKLNADFVPEICEYNKSGVYFNKCFTEAYSNLKDAVLSKTEDKLFVMSAYRSKEEQSEIIQSEGETAAQLNCSEHQAGLAADVYVMYHAGMGFLESKAGEFVNENCDDYGFIIRYPYYGTNSTGIDYEPWHIRFTGLPHSKIISDNKLTLEEYINSLVPEKIYIYGDYVISRQKTGEAYFLPKSFASAVISPDNTGCVIITAKIK